MNSYKIHPIVTGTKVFDKSMMTYQHGQGIQYTIPIYSWYLEGSNQKIIVDTGEMHPVISEGREKQIGGKIYKFEDGLAKWNLKPEDIDIVIHTHLHNDHCENDYKCINAKFFIHVKELERIHNPHPLDYRYVEDFIDEIEDNHQIELIKNNTKIVPGIEVIHTPAHTEGGLTILVATEQGKAAITGFCIIDDNINPSNEIKAMEMDVIPPGTHINVYESYDILLKIKKLADIILPLHEPRFSSIDTIPF